MFKSRHLLVALLVAIVFVPAAIAQPLPGPCTGDDGFNLGCCNIPQPNLPPFPGIQLNAVYACFNGCAIQQQQANIQITQPNFFLCDYAVATANMQVLAGGAVVSTWTGMILLKYSRTWAEIGVGGAMRQVYRFLVNGEFSVALGPIAAPCIPAEVLAPFNLRPHLNGHIDYACTPGIAGMQAIVSLTRLPGCIQFAPYSTTPIAALTAGAAGATSYHFVGPAPFVLGGAFPEPQGPLVAEAVRESRLNWAPFAYGCLTEAPLAGGNLQTVNVNCMCGGPALTSLWKHQNLNGATCCVGAIWPFNSVPIPLAGFPFPTGLAALNLGSWAGPAGTFPGTRSLNVYIGILNYAGPCPLGPGNFPIHAINGVGTRTPAPSAILYPALVPVACVPPFVGAVSSCIDYQNSIPIAQAVAANANLPGIGSLAASTAVWNLNTP